MQTKNTQEKSRPFMKLGQLIALLVLLWLGGCATQVEKLPSSPVKSVQLPPLPKYAQQPPMPPECSPTCETNLTSVRESWLARLMMPTLPVPPAPGSTTKPVKP